MRQKSVKGNFAIKPFGENIFSNSHKMKFNGLTTIFFAVLTLFPIFCSGQAPPNCYSNVAILCAGGGPKVNAKAGQGPCETYENKCLVEQLNCIRYDGGEPRKLID